MPGHGRPRGPLCLLRKDLTLGCWPMSLLCRAMILSIVLASVVLQSSATHGQRIRLQSESFHPEVLDSGTGALRSSRWRVNQMLKKSQSRPFARRPMLPLQRLESGRVVDRPRLAEVIKARDSIRLVDGDWQAMAFEQNTAGLFEGYGQLPDRQFSDVPHAKYTNLESLPIAVRQSQADEQFYFYLANATPWRVRVRLRLTADVSDEAIASIRSMSQVKFDSAVDANNAKVLMVDLSPYDLAGGSAMSLGAIKSYTFEYLDDVASDLRKQVFALQVKLQQAQQVGAIGTLTNPEFRSSEADMFPIQGWEIGQQPQARFQLRDDSAELGDQSAIKQIDQLADTSAKRLQSYLQLHSTADEVTWIRSQPITATETGRLSISVWLRLPSGADKVPEVRMAVDGQTPNGEYYRFGVVGRQQSDSLASLGPKWKRFAVHFDDLPNEMTDLRIGFDFVGEGKVDVGHVELFDRWFDKSDAKAITQLLASADAMLRQPAQFDRCRRLLQENWAMFLDDHFQLKSVPKNAQQPVPMFRPKVAQAPVKKKPKPENDQPKAGQSLNR